MQLLWSPDSMGLSHAISQQQSVGFFPPFPLEMEDLCVLLISPSPPSYSMLCKLLMVHAELVPGKYGGSLENPQ